MRTAPRIGINVHTDADFREAALPLFSDGLVDAIEWDIDETWGFDDAPRAVPDWVDALLDVYADDGALYGHGVWFSLLSARLEPRQQRWLAHLANECTRRPYRHVSEHFGWLTAGAFSRNTNLPCPRSEAAVAIGVDRVGRLAEAAGTPFGLENSSVALGRVDAEQQGGFLADVLGRAHAFLVLDVHNVWTQAVNLDLDAHALLATYPLDRVRELHVSGGDWVHLCDREVRTDSHDGDVPAPVWELAHAALARCSSLEVVFLERRPGTLDSDAARKSWRADFARLRSLAEPS